MSNNTTNRLTKIFQDDVLKPRIQRKSVGIFYKRSLPAHTDDLVAHHDSLILHLVQAGITEKYKRFFIYRAPEGDIIWYILPSKLTQNTNKLILDSTLVIDDGTSNFTLTPTWVGSVKANKLENHSILGEFNINLCFRSDNVEIKPNKRLGTHTLTFTEAGLKDSTEQINELMQD